MATNTRKTEASTCGRREFTTHSRSWYAPSSPLAAYIDDDIVLSDGEGKIEIVIEWNLKVAGDDGKPSPQLTIFDESWSAFAAWPDLFAAMSKFGPQSSPSVAEFEALLLTLGFVDKTTTEPPADVRVG